MSYKKADLIYEGKAKKVYALEGQDKLYLLEYKDSLTAFNAQKKGEFQGKGKVNREISSLIFKLLKQENIQSHFVDKVNDHEMICQKLEMIPLEVVVRNIMAGSTAKKFFLEEGVLLKKPLVELFYKKDEWNDPFINDEQALMLEACSESELSKIKLLALKINDCLKEFFLEAKMNLVDFKLEFGRSKEGEIVLADEISPDSCRIWDLKTKKKMDKDRFRHDLGEVEKNYREILKRLESVAQ